MPLIFISHSLGGLIAKKAYLLASSDPKSAYADIAQACAAFVFFSTPHRGFHKSTVINDILSVSVPRWRSTTYSDVLTPQLAKLHDITEKFRDAASQFDITSFYEQPSSDYSVASISLALPQHFTTLDHPSETDIPLDADHLSITKFPSPNDRNFRSVQCVLRFLVEKFKPRAIPMGTEDAASQIEEVMQLLQGVDTPHDDLSFSSENRIDGSCESIFEIRAMEGFIADARPYSQVLWCSGGPGSGKSVTAKYIIQSLMDESKPCAYYFFRSGNGVKNSLGQFLTAVALQLAQIIPEYRRKLCSLAANRFDIGKAGQRLLWKTLFASTLFQCNLQAPFYIVVDGLDEFPHAKELLQKMFVEAGDARIYLRLLLVSRSTLDVETSIERLSKRMQVQRLIFDGNKEDLAMYVREQMEDMMGNDVFKERTLQEVIAKANGNFLWAHLVKEIIECQTEGQVEDALRQVPKELEPLYERMDTQLANCFRSRPQEQRMGHLIMMWATCARRPLRLTELKVALEQDYPGIMDMRQTVPKLCREFIVVDRNELVSMSHASAREFLMSNEQLYYHIDADKTNQVLFSKCLLALVSSRRGYNALDDSTRVFSNYAALCWPYHLMHSSG